ncbi:polysaccharide pyruvyl transferase family protein [Aquicoccus sp. SCR17]|nr:polysaccharide pyruvyl transferase family protein [Carideicomes alvinocaridis]
MLKIALIGHDTRNDNLGVGALTVSEIELIRRIARRRGVEVQILVLAGQGRASCVSGEDVVEQAARPLRKPWEFFFALRSCDLAIDISGGDSFADIYGNRRIFQILLQKFLVHWAGLPLVMAPQTVGPFKKPLWRALASLSIKRCAIIATRDSKSVTFLRTIGVRGPIVEASDLALRLPFEVMEPKGKRIKVGLNVSGLLMHGGFTGNNMFGLKEDYPKLIRNIIEHFKDVPDAPELHLVAHVIPQDRGGVEDDYQACIDLQKEFPETVVAPAFKTPSEAKTYISCLDFFLGARMHACIAAFSSGVPVIPMAYSRKFSGLFGALGYNRVVDCKTDSLEEALDKVSRAFEERDVLKEEVSTALEIGWLKTENYESALEEIMISVWAGNYDHVSVRR